MLGGGGGEGQSLSSREQGNGNKYDSSGLEDKVMRRVRGQALMVGALFVQRQGHW